MSPRPARRGRNRQGQNRLRASQVRLDRLFYVGYLKQGDILCVNMDDIIYDFTVCLPYHHLLPCHTPHTDTREPKRLSTKETSP